MASNADELIRKIQRAFARRAPLDAIRQEHALQFAPDLAYFTEDATEGEPYTTHILDPTGAIAARTLTGQIGAMLRSGEYFEPGLGDGRRPNIRAKRVFEHMGRVTRAILYESRAGYRRTATMADRNMVLFGEAPMLIEDRYNPSDPGIRTRAIHPSKMAFEDDLDGVTTMHFHRCDYTYRGCAKLFTRKLGEGPEYGNCHPEMLRRARDTPDHMANVTRVVMPRKDYEFEYRNPGGNLEWVSIYVDMENRQIIRERPLRHNPYVIPRWQMLPGKPDGYSPCTIFASPLDARMQQMYLSMVENAEKQADPPVKITADAVVRGGVDLRAGGVTHVSTDYDEKSGKALEPIQIGGDMRIAMEAIRDARLTMGDIFYLNQLQMPEGVQKTAYETAILLQEWVRKNLPLIEPLEDELNVRVLDRVFEIGLSNDAFGPAEEWVGELPEEARGRDVKWELSNPLRDAQSAKDGVEYQRTLEFLAPAMQLDPEAAQSINLTQALEDAVATTGRSHWIHSDEEKQARIQALQQAQQAQQEMEMIKDGSAAVKNAGMGLSAMAGSPAQSDARGLAEMLRGRGVGA